MKQRAEALKAKIGVLISDLMALSQDVEKMDNRDKVSLENEGRLAQKTRELSIKELELKAEREKLESNRSELSSYSQTLAKREISILKKEEDIKRLYTAIETMKSDLVKRELAIVDLEDSKVKLEGEKAKLGIEKRDFEIIAAKVEKERLLARDRKDLMDEREKKIAAQEELLRKRLNV